jgi:hypothetical protein
MTLRIGEWLLMSAAGLLGLWAAFRWRIERNLDRLLALLAPMGAGAILIHLLKRLANGPNVDMNASRVANAIALVKGYNIMPGVNDGPLLDFMYGPMFVVAYTPAALATTPSGAIWIGILQSFLFILAPFVYLAFTSTEQRSRLIAAVAVVCFGLFCTFDRALSWVTWYIMADGPALVLAGFACAFLLGRPTDRMTPRMVAAALFAVLAVWSKQTLAPIVVALPLYVWLLHDWRTALRFTFLIGATGIAVSLVFVLWFGFDGIWFNMFQVPGGHPWKGSLTGESRLTDLHRSLTRLMWTGSVAGALVLAVGVTSWRSRPSFREWLRSQPWTCLVWVALFMVPTAAMAGAKIGGEQNVYAICTYFLTGAAVLGVAQTTASSHARVRDAAKLTLALIMTVAVVVELGSIDRYVALRTAVNQLRNWRSNAQEQGYAFARAHPDEVHFIGDPLIGLYADGKLYSDMFGRYDRELAGFRPDPRLMHAYSPSRLRYVVVRRDFPWFTQPARFPEYKDFTKPVQVDNLTYHLVWERP